MIPIPIGIVESVREGTHVKQRTLLNLGKDFAIEPAHWPLLTARIDQLLHGSSAAPSGVVCFSG